MPGGEGRGGGVGWGGGISLWNVETRARTTLGYINSYINSYLNSYLNNLVRVLVETEKGEGGGREE